MGADQVLQQQDLLRPDRVEEGACAAVRVLSVVCECVCVCVGSAYASQNPIGVLAQLDDVCNFPKGTDEKFLAKLGDAFQSHAHFTMDGGPNEFTIKHYAGDVRCLIGTMKPC